ncbi:hypothetical protein [Laribacter hongkongensis]|uniref:hypothetical protein n=1 Tax=Laribacter hongkongensis TaxID=168471 RepID=UPI001EFC64B3|nr:hypothetical protein [Laribacter hongkongensis]MCG9093990.1 hypothetical protein [Laribacter hongkongensis]
MLANLSELHRAIVAGLQHGLPQVPYVDAYPVVESRIRLPAILVELSEMEPGHDPGTGETALVVRMQARVVIDPNLTDADMLVRELAARVAIIVNHQCWQLPIGMSELVQIGEDAFKPELDGYLVWLVEWQHEIHLGELDEMQMPDGATSIVVTVTPEPGAQESVDTGANHEL